jgi:hypothetical protein
VDGPDWAGLRELYPAEVDYKALVKQARGFVPIMESGNLILTLADAVEALAAENEKLRDQIDAARDSAAKKGWNLQNERDEWRSIALRERAEGTALQARLDAMTVEWGTAAVAGDDRTIHRDTFRSEDAARNARGYGESVVTRLVGPWTVVPEGDDHE